jgi:hypothetical protein
MARERNGARQALKAADALSLFVKRRLQKLSRALKSLGWGLAAGASNYTLERALKVSGGVVSRLLKKFFARARRRGRRGHNFKKSQKFKFWGAKARPYSFP